MLEIRESRSVVLADGSAWQRNLIQFDPHSRPLAESPIRAGGVYLITGGLGDIGLEVARWLAKQNRIHLVLLSRRGLAPREEWQKILAQPHADPHTVSRIRAVQSLESYGGEVWPRAGDVANGDFMAHLIEQLLARHGRLDGVFHLAGVLKDGMVWNRSVEDIQHVLRPKIHGAWVLHEVTRQLPLDLFVCFSSISSFAPLPGQAAYAAGNAFLDAIVHYRRRILNLPGTTINWGVWRKPRQ